MQSVLIENLISFGIKY